MADGPVRESACSGLPCGNSVRCREDRQNRGYRPGRAAPRALCERGRMAGNCARAAGIGFGPSAAALHAAGSSRSPAGSAGSDSAAGLCYGVFRQKDRGFVASSCKGRRPQIQLPVQLVVAGSDGPFVPRGVAIRQWQLRCHATETIRSGWSYAVSRNSRNGSGCGRTHRDSPRSRTLLRVREAS